MSNPGACWSISKLYCNSGHPLFGPNLQIRGGKRAGSRRCRTCNRKQDSVKSRAGRGRRYFQLILNTYGSQCACCGETELAFLSLDHINNDGAQHRKARGPQGACIYLDVIREGYPKDRYQILCMNCNWARRYGKTCPHQRPILEIVRSA